MKVNKTDKLIVLLFFISIAIGLYYSGLSQTEGASGYRAPFLTLLLPFGVGFLQVVRIIALVKKVKLDYLARLWLYIFLYYIFAFLVGWALGHRRYDYNTFWFVFCPPITWMYFNLLIKNEVSFSELLIKWGFWFLVLLSAIDLYFIPRSIRMNGYFASLNTGYYVLMAYPLAMMNDNKVKRAISTILMLLVVFLSMKRGGILAVSLGYMLYYLLSLKRHLMVKVISIIFFAGVIFYVVPMINDYTNGTLEHRFEVTMNQGDEEGRGAMYPIVWKSVLKSSLVEFVVGHGHNTVSSDMIVNGLSAHNDYLEFLYDYGVIGLSLLLLYQIQLVKITRRTSKLENGFLSTIVALTIVITISMVSVVYAYGYFIIIIPFWCVINQQTKERRNIIK